MKATGTALRWFVEGMQLQGSTHAATLKHSAAVFLVGHEIVLVTWIPWLPVLMCKEGSQSRVVGLKPDALHDAFMALQIPTNIPASAHTSKVSTCKFQTAKGHQREEEVCNACSGKWTGRQANLEIAAFLTRKPSVPGSLSSYLRQDQISQDRI